MNSELAKKLLSPEVDEQIERLSSQVAEKDGAAREALNEMLPGPAREAFDPDGNIRVGEFCVRPACDYDLKVMSTLNSRFYNFFLKGENKMDTLPTGPDAWELCYIMTNPARGIANQIKSGGIEQLKDAAQNQFAFLKTGQIAEIVLACISQVSASYATMLSHDNASDQSQGNGEAAKSAHPPS